MIDMNFIFSIPWNSHTGNSIDSTIVPKVNKNNILFSENLSKLIIMITKTEAAIKAKKLFITVIVEYISETFFILL